MSEANTKDLTQDEKLDLLLVEMGGMKAEMGGMKAEMGGMKAEMGGMKAEMGGMKAEMGGMKADIHNLDARLTSVEAKIDERLHDTRPIWAVINTRTEKLVEQYGQMAETLRLIEKQLNVLNKDVLRVRAEQEFLDNRLDLLEQRPS